MAAKEARRRAVVGEPPQADRGLQFRVRGMDCAEEVAALTRELTPLTGGEERLSFDLLHGKLAVRIDGARAAHRLSVLEVIG